jgi:imidazolonepropionase-like amidohydrolase
MATKTTPQSFALVGVDIETVTKGMIKGGTVVVRNGKIAAVGKKVAIPKGVKKINAKGKTVTPGFIDCHSHAGLAEDGFDHDADVNECSDPITPHLLAMDGFKPSDRALPEIAAAGVTTLWVTVGSGNLFGGIGAVVKSAAPSFDQQIVLPEHGMKMALGENPKRVYGGGPRGKGGSPQTRMGIAAMFRKAFAEADLYKRKKDAHAKKAAIEAAKKPKKGEKKLPPEPFTPDPKMEAICRLMAGDLVGRCHAHRSVDMLAFMRIADNYKFRYCFEHATEAIDCLDELVKRKIPVIIGPTMHGRMKLELFNRTPETVVRCIEAGLVTAITTDHFVIPGERLPVLAAIAMREGLSREDALKVMTINPAKILGLDKRLGSIERGKEADLVVWDGDPLDIRNKPTDVYIAGRRVEA